MHTPFYAAIWNLYTIFCTCFILGVTSKLTESEWSAWSKCSKSCDVGTQKRTRLINGLTVAEKQFCNLQYCPDLDKYCENTAECKSKYRRTFGDHVTCNLNQYNGRCVCSLRSNTSYASFYNPNNCFPQYGYCVIRKNRPKNSAGLVEEASPVHRCVSPGYSNNYFEVHMIGAFGSYHDHYDIEIRARGDTSQRPIVLALSSFEPVIWTIHTTVEIYAVIYDYNPSATGSSRRKVKRGSDSTCFIRNIYRLPGIHSADGDDTGTGNTIRALQILNQKFGHITSFTGFFHLSGKRMVTITVGGNPLQIISPDYAYHQYCNPAPVPKNLTESSFTEWSTWSGCSKVCNIGKQDRHRVVDGVIETDQQYCNLHYCPGNWKSCDNGRENDCSKTYRSVFRPLDSTCNNQSRCICTIGSSPSQDISSRSPYYNKYNCMVEYGHCVMRVNPPFSVGVANKRIRGYRTKGCMTNDNDVYEVHMIGISIYSHSIENYTLHVRPRGDPSGKPLVIALCSFAPLRWTIDSTVAVYAVVYGGEHEPSVYVAEHSVCTITNIYRLKGLQYKLRGDSGGTDILSALQTLNKKFGQVTSFTEFYSLERAKEFTLEVGGNPFQVDPRRSYFSPSDRSQCVPITPPPGVTFSPVPPYNTEGYLVSTSQTTNKLAEAPFNNNIIIAICTIVPVVGIVLLICFCYRKRRKAQEATGRNQQNIHRTENSADDAQLQHLTHQETQDQNNMNENTYMYNSEPPPYESIEPCLKSDNR